MIINTGSRTDIPAYFSDWFLNRIKEGFVFARNPYYPNLMTKYILSPSLVDCLVFCTKNPEPMLPRLNEISEYGQLWFVTITPYDEDIEPNVPSTYKVINSFKRLSKSTGVEKVIWRYDPIFVSEKYDLDYHIKKFEWMSSELNGYTNECVISFIDLYEKTKRNFPDVKEVKQEERHKLGEAFFNIGKKYDINIKTCLEGQDLSKYGIDCSGCMTQPVIEKAIGKKLKIPKLKQAREGCDCLLGNDIGVYNTCGHGCIYCYANYDQKNVRNNLKNHNPNSPLLIGNLKESDTMRNAKQVSFINPQTTLF
jgi:DNA repair photolyase